MQIPREAPPPDIPVNDQASSPCLDPWPPHDDSRGCEDDKQERADTIDAATRVPGEQIVVQLEELGNEPDSERRRSAEIFARVRIE